MCGVPRTRGVCWWFETFAFKIKYSKPIPKTFGFKYIISQDSFFQRAVLYNYKDRSGIGARRHSTMSSLLPARQRYASPPSPVSREKRRRLRERAAAATACSGP
jgi:hypothetical protein